MSTADQLIALHNIEAAARRVVEWEHAKTDPIFVQYLYQLHQAIRRLDDARKFA